jgi:hypothetical protein
MTKFSDIEQNSDEWYSLRLGKVTASSFAVFMANYGKTFGEPAKKYAVRLALERITGVRSESGFTNDHMERGHQQEPIARMLYEEMTFINVDNGGFFHADEYGCSPDGLVGTDGLIEIKSVIGSVHYDNMSRGSFDPAYRWQLIGHLEVTGREWCDFVSYCSEFPNEKQLLVYRLHREDCLAEIAQLRERRADFLQLVRKIETNILSRGHHEKSEVEPG